jgi:DNA-binding response OmpR family regulator
MGAIEKQDVLIIDDDFAIRMLLSRTLERAGMRCGVASDGVDATDQIEKTDYALVLLDLMMPRLDGVGFVKSLRDRQERGGARPVVLMMTAAPDRQDLTSTGDMVQAVLSKPFDIHDIVGLCHDCVAAIHDSEATGITDATLAPSSGRLAPL